MESVINLFKDAMFAQELQFREALVASMINFQMTKSSPVAVAEMQEARPEPATVKETGESSLSFCELCTERKETNQMIRNESCVHSSCLNCISKHVMAMIKDGNSIVTCPSSNCTSILELDVFRPLLSKEVVDRWQEALCKQLFVASTKLYCPFKDCSAMFVDDKEGEDIRESECPVCHRLFCAQCSAPWHSGLNCEDYQRQRRMKIELAMENKLDTSPQCKAEDCPQNDCSEEPHKKSSTGKGSGKPSTAGTHGKPASDRNNTVEASSSIVKQKSDDVSSMSLNSAQNGGKCADNASKSCIKSETDSTKRWNTWPRNKWFHKKQAGNGCSQPPLASETADCLPLDHGVNHQSRTDSTPSSGSKDGEEKVQHDVEVNNVKSTSSEVSDDDDSDAYDNLSSDSSDSDASPKSHGKRKVNSWLGEFIQELNNLSIKELNDPTRQWHCPACRGCPGAIRKYKGLHPLLAHANGKGKQRVKLHQELAQLLEKELQRGKTPITPVVERVSAKWKGFGDEKKDREIVWPPMVVIMNTGSGQDVNHKRIGMGNQDLLKHFGAYSPVKAQNFYGPQGHRGMGVLIFESSADGYLEAERLHEHFVEERRGRNAWSHSPVLHQPGGERQLYGYLAVKEDLDMFNQNNQGKNKLKYEMRSYQQMVIHQVKQMMIESKQLPWLKFRVVHEQSRAEALQENLRDLTEKLDMRTKELQIVRQRANLQRKQHQEELEYLEQFSKDQINTILEAQDPKDENLQLEQN